MKIKKHINSNKVEEIISMICCGTLVFSVIYFILTYTYIDNTKIEYKENELICPITYMSYNKILQNYKVSYIDNFGKVQTFFAHDIYISDAKENTITFYFNDFKYNDTEDYNELFAVTLEDAIENSKLNEAFKISVTKEMYDIAINT